jgi:hypothetical protein
MVYDKAYRKKWRAENADKERASRRAWYLRNKDKVRGYCKKWSAKNRDRLRKYSMDWYFRHKNQHQAYCKAYKTGKILVNGKSMTRGSYYAARWRAAHPELHKKRAKVYSAKYRKRPEVKAAQLVRTRRYYARHAEERAIKKALRRKHWMDKLYAGQLFKKPKNVIFEPEYLGKWAALYNLTPHRGTLYEISSSRHGKMHYFKIAIDGRKELLHRAIVEGYLGRKLGRHIVVHHKDGNPLNNDVANLQEMSIRDHIQLHVAERQGV